jgi:ribonuclease R
MGDKVTIKVVAANLVKRQLDYEWVLTSTVEDDEELSHDKAKHKHKVKLKKKKLEE